MTVWSRDGKKKPPPAAFFRGFAHSDRFVLQREIGRFEESENSKLVAIEFQEKAVFDVVE